MAGGFNDWSMNPGDRNRLRETLEKQAMGSTDPADVEAQVSKWGKRKLAEMWAAARGTKIESQMRNINRYLKGQRRMATPAMQGVVKDCARKQAAEEIRAKGTLRFEMKATFVTSRKPWKGKASGSLTGSALDAFASAIESGDYEAAMQIGAGAYFDDPDMVMEMRNLEEMGWM